MNRIERMIVGELGFWLIGQDEKRDGLEIAIAIIECKFLDLDSFDSFFILYSCFLSLVKNKLI